MNSNHRVGRLRRPPEEMPGNLERLLEERGLRSRYEDRPPYQRNDYLRWIKAAKRDATRQRRIRQMLDELEGGGIYMAMPWNGGAPQHQEHCRPPPAG